MTRVAIVVVTHDSAAEIGPCLQALASLPDLEVVVVDNASSDPTCATVLAHSVRLIANTVNTGFAAAVNQGVRATTAPFVLLLNPDAHLVRGLDALIRRCEDPQTGGAGGLLTGTDGLPQTGFMARNLPTPTALVFEILGINHLWPDNPANWHYRCKGLDPMTAALVEQPAGAFFMFPRQVWQQLGGFDETFRPVWFEDVDFCARIKAAGLRVWYEPLALASHAGSHSIRSLSRGNREQYWYGNLLEYAAKYYRSPAFRTVCAAVVMGSILRALRELPRSGVKSWVKILPVYVAVASRATGLFFGRRKDAVPDVI